MLKLLSASVLAIALAPGLALAQSPTADDLAERLAAPPKPVVTRSLRGAAAAQPVAATRQIVVVPGRQDEVIKEKAGLPSVDLRVQFDFNSATVTPEGQELVKTLAQALKNPKLQGAKFLVGGHTDAKGSEEFNQGLSERRAQAVRDLLVKAHGVAPDKVVSMGFGKRQLANAKDPEDGVNRRVEVVNLSAN